MSVETMAVVLHHSKAKGTAKLVLLGIANHDGDGGAWPAVSTLARYANVDVRNVQRAIAQLVALGELHVHVNGGGDRRAKDHERPNRYDVAIACPPACDRTTRHRLRDLPRAPAQLWIEGVADSPGGGDSATGGVAPAPPGGVADSPPEPPIPTNHEQHLRLVGNAQTARASLCAVCSLDEAECQRRSRTSGHTYRKA